MKLKVTNIIVSLLVVVGFSCKKHETQNKTDVETTKGIEQPLKIANQLIFDIDLETTEPDDFRVIANNIFLNNNQFMDITITQKLNSNETSKKMRFEFPKGIQPDYQIGFSLGNKITKEVKINGIVISYGDLVYEITPENFNKYFRLNKYIISTEKQGVFKTKKIDGKHNPIIFLRKTFIDKF